LARVLATDNNCTEGNNREIVPFRRCKGERTT
jgi:hypothetical protein